MGSLHLGIVCERCLLSCLYGCNALHKVFVADVHTVVTQSQHTRLYTHSLQLSTVHIVRCSSEFSEIDVAVHRHAAGVNLENPLARVFIWKRELHFTIQAATTEQGKAVVWGWRGASMWQRIKLFTTPTAHTR